MGFKLENGVLYADTAEEIAVIMKLLRMVPTYIDSPKTRVNTPKKRGTKVKARSLKKKESEILTPKEEKAKTQVDCSVGDVFVRKTGSSAGKKVKITGLRSYHVITKAVVTAPGKTKAFSRRLNYSTLKDSYKKVH